MTDLKRALSCGEAMIRHEDDKSVFIAAFLQQIPYAIIYNNPGIFDGGAIFGIAFLHLAPAVMLYLVNLEDSQVEKSGALLLQQIAGDVESLLDNAFHTRN